MYIVSYILLNIYRIIIGFIKNITVRGNMKEIILPRIVAVGIYNAQQAVKNRSVTQNRKTSMFEIELPIGEGGVSYMDTESVAIAEDMIICAKPGQVRHTRLPFKCYFIHMTVGEGELYDRLIKLPSYIAISDRSAFEELFKQLCACYDTALDGDRLLLQSRVLELIYRLGFYTQESSYQSKTNHKETIEKVLAYIKAHLTEDLSLEVVSEYASFSPIYFHNFFKKSTGMTLREYVEEQRFQRAVNLLFSRDMTLSEIAYECGFSSQSYFSCVFKKRTGMTPRQYVKELYRRYEK